MAVILDGKALADKTAAGLKARVDGLKLKGIEPKLIVFTSTDPASQVYVRNKVKRGTEIGIEVKTVPVSSGEEIEYALFGNDTPFIIQFPSDVSQETANYYISNFFARDMDGLSSRNAGWLSRNMPLINPCTPMGIIDLLDYYKIPIDGKKVTIIGRSDIVGKPLAMMMLNRNATVTICHSKTSIDDLECCCDMADIIVSAVGNPDLFRGEKHYFVPNLTQTLVDVGINRVNGKLCGDFPHEFYDCCHAYTPVPGGIGPMTVVELMKNVVDYYDPETN